MSRQRSEMLPVCNAEGICTLKSWWTFMEGRSLFIVVWTIFRAYLHFANKCKSNFAQFYHQILQEFNYCVNQETTVVSFIWNFTKRWLLFPKKKKKAIDGSTPWGIGVANKTFLNGYTFTTAAVMRVLCVGATTRHSMVSSNQVCHAQTFTYGNIVLLWIPFLTCFLYVRVWGLFCV